MKKFSPILIASSALIIAGGMACAQSKIHNPDLPKGLIFQWKIVTNQVHPSWLNSDFTIARSDGQLTILYGAYESLGGAMSNIPDMPESAETESVSLIPFFNQTSISAADALTLIGNRNWQDFTDQQMEDAVSFTVYFNTYRSPKSGSEFSDISEPLSFEILGQQAFAYSAGEFGSLKEAETYRDALWELGYERAEVNRFLNGEKVALCELEEIFAYVGFGF